MDKGASSTPIRKLNKVILQNICSTEMYNLIFIDEDLFSSNDDLFDCLYELHTHSKNFVVFTANLSFEHRSNLLRAGALDYLDKPIVGENFALRLQVLRGQISRIRDVNRSFKLQRVFSWFFNAIEHGMEAIEIWTANANIQYVNIAHSLLTGYSRWEMIGTNVFSHFASYVEIETFVTSAWKQLTAKKSASSWTGTVNMRRKNGAISSQEITITPVRSVEGSVKYFIANKRDITESKKKADNLLLASKQAVEASEMKSKFLARMSHDIRNLVSSKQNLFFPIVKIRIKVCF